MYLCRLIQCGRTEQVEAYIIISERFFLALVILPYKILNSTVKLSAFLQLPVAFCYRRAVAVCTRYENYVILTDTVTQESCVCIRKYEHTADMTEMKLFITVRHTACDYRSFREGRSVIL